jgi:hypothetical protein
MSVTACSEFPENPANGLVFCIVTDGLGVHIRPSLFVQQELLIIQCRSQDFCFDHFKSGGLHEKNSVGIWNWGTISAFA